MKQCNTNIQNVYNILRPVGSIDLMRVAFNGDSSLPGKCDNVQFCEILVQRVLRVWVVTFKCYVYFAKPIPMSYRRIKDFLEFLIFINNNEIQVIFMDIFNKTNLKTFMIQ